MAHSESISQFLSFLRECSTQLSIATQIEADATSETQDVLHKLELDPPGYHDRAKLASALTAIRRQRRAAKDDMSILEPIVAWTDEHKDCIRSLEKLLGEVRKEEKATEGRMYWPRTEAVKRALGGESS